VLTPTLADDAPRRAAHADALRNPPSRAMTFTEAFDAHLRDIYTFFTYRLGSRRDAEDLTQTTFERAFRSWGRYDPARASVRTWLLAIARNLLIDHQRARPQRRERAIEEGWDVAAPEERLDLGLDAALAAALQCLNGREREVIALRFGGDLTGPEIAAVTRLSVGNVHQLTSRALRRLRAELEGRPENG
jgi:RNA polymerase sigma-70 factor (ECF subfamily)